MLAKFNDRVQYSILEGTNLCTLFAKPTHTLNDILKCKAHIRKSNKYVLFRPTVDVKMSFGYPY